MTNYRLHYFPESGNSYKLALMLTLCEQAFDLNWTDFGGGVGGVTWSADFRENLNEMGEIPILEEDGTRLTQTGPILLRLAKRYGKFGGANELEEFEILRWLFWDNHKLSGYMAAYRFFRTFTPSPDEAVLAFMRGRLDDFLGILERNVADKDFVIGDQPSIADFSMIGYLCFPPEESGYDWAETHPSIKAWIDRIAGLPGWQAPYDLLPGKHLHHYR